MSVFPNGIPSYDPFITPITLQAMGHTARHKSMESDIVALATKIGVDGSTDPATVQKRLADAQAAIVAAQAAIDDLEALQANLVTLTGNQVLTNKTLTTPTIASFTNAQHDHSTATKGGQIPTDGIVDGAVTRSKVPQRHTLYRHYDTVNGTVFSAGYSHVPMNTSNRMYGITLNGQNQAIIQRSGVYAMNLKYLCTDVPTLKLGYFDVVYPAGYLGEANPTPTLYANEAPSFARNTGINESVSVSFVQYLPAGTIVAPGFYTNGQTRLGAGSTSRIKTDTYWSIDEVLSGI